jgi:tetratricopeptide (TPR) repeat protein
VATPARYPARPAHLAALLALAVLCCAGCADEAHRELLLALGGDENGLSYEEQIVHLDRAIALAPDRLSYRVTRARTFIDMRRFDRAIADLDFTLARREHAYEHYMRGLARCQQGRPAQALPDFDRAIALQPENSQFYRGRALARVELGRTDDALDDAETLVRLAPNHGHSYYTRGRALHAAGRPAAALEDLDRVVAMRPELVFPREARAEVREALGDPEGAAADRAEVERMTAQGRPVWAWVDPFRY